MRTASLRRTVPRTDLLSLLRRTPVQLPGIGLRSSLRGPDRMPHCDTYADVPRRRVSELSHFQSASYLCRYLASGSVAIICNAFCRIPSSLTES